MAGRAIVLEVKKGVCTVVTADGEFLRVRVRGDFSPGQEMLLPQTRRRINRLVLLAASLLLFFAATILWKDLLTPAVAAYVSLEMNPAVELALDGKNVVRGVRPLDGSGEELAVGLKLTGLPLEEAVDKIISTAVGKKIIPAEGIVVVSAVTPAGELADPSSLDLLVRNTVESSLRSMGISARVLVGRASEEARGEAGRAGISTGRYMLYREAARKGVPVEAEDFRKKSIVSIEKEKKIKIRGTLEVETENQSPAIYGPLRVRGNGRIEDGRGGDRVKDDPGRARDSAREEFRPVQTPAGDSRPSQDQPVQPVQPVRPGQPGEDQREKAKDGKDHKDNKDNKDKKDLPGISAPGKDQAKEKAPPGSPAPDRENGPASGAKPGREGQGGGNDRPEAGPMAGGSGQHVQDRL